MGEPRASIALPFDRLRANVLSPFLVPVQAEFVGEYFPSRVLRRRFVEDADEVLV